MSPAQPVNLLNMSSNTLSVPSASAYWNPSTITTTGADGSYYAPAVSLGTFLGAEAGNFTIVPTALLVGFGADSQTIVDFLKAMGNVPYISLFGEVAFAPVVYDAILVYAKTVDGFADVGIVDFVRGALTSK